MIRTITGQTARRLAIASQFLDAPSRNMLETIRQLGCLQLDPTKAVIQNHFLVLWSRLGAYDIATFNHLMWEERALFEYWAHAASIVLTEHYPIHQHIMTRYVQSKNSRTEWVQQNDALRQHVLKVFRERGASQLKEIEGNDQVDLGWHTSGWTSGRNIDRMVDHLWLTGEIGVANRLKGGFRVWDVSERILPEWTPRHDLTEEGRVRQSLKIALNALGLGTSKHVNYHFTRGEYPKMKHHLEQLANEGAIERVNIAENGTEWKGEWYVGNTALLERIEAHDWQPRHALLSPFDNLICDRGRIEQLFNFYFRLEIYTPASKRQYGYFVMPFLYEDVIVGRIDPQFNRKTNSLDIHAIHWETIPTPEQKMALRQQIENLASWLGAISVNGL